MPSIKSYPLPPSVPPEARPWLQDFMTYFLARFDPRNPESDFADGLRAEADGRVVLGEAYPEGRDASLVTLTGRINDAGSAADSRFLRPVTAANLSSVQSAAPLTATATSTTATIAIAAHTVRFDFGLRSYGAGSITGLTPNTRYYVYASDPLYVAGAVLYTATTDPQTVTSNSDFYFVGAITTAVAANTVNVVAASSANPVVIRSNINHGWNSGQFVTFASLPGAFAALNGNTYTLTRVDDDEFSVPVDGSGFAAYTTGGTATRVSTATDGTGGGGGGWIYDVP